MPLSAVIVVGKTLREVSLLLGEVLVEVDALLEGVDHLIAWDIGERVLHSVIIKALDDHAFVWKTGKLLMDLYDA